uniref:Uncharacterized protein n=1 Tax=Spironucleus salmonicida TaxID=348837 RepID=V6LFS3_9EUKA|eukprot:EST43395.1 hypothetical protein SS50377_17079 [Spironucleus salmonicida]
MPKDVIVPAVFLNNIFQAHQVEIVMPRKQKPPRVPSPPLSPTSRALLESFGLQRVEPSADRMQIPAYLTPEAVDAASRALEAEAAEDRLLGLYAQFYASPQLLPALNEVLPAELHFAPYQDFLNAPAMQCSGATKRLQLSPPDARLLDDNVQRLLYRGFPPQPTAHPVRFCTSYARAACRGFRTAGPQHPRACKISQVSSAFDQEEYEQVAAQFGLSNQSRFTDEFKVEVSKKFLGLVKDGPNLYRFKNIMQEYENGSINQELLQFCFTMIFFGQLEAIYYFQLMQKNGILDPRGDNFGWPACYPVDDEVGAIVHIIQRVEAYYQQCLQKRGGLIQELYTEVFAVQRKAYEASINKFSGIKIIKGDVKAVGDQVEVKVQHQNGFSFVKVPRDMYEAGASAQVHTAHFKTLYQHISDQIQLKQRPKKASTQPSAAAPQPSQSEEPSQGRHLLTAPKLASRVDASYHILQLVKAGKLSKLTVFDLDSFFQLMICLSANLHLGYPSFSFQEYNQKCGFGLQLAIQRSPCSHFLAAFRMFFGAQMESAATAQSLHRLIDVAVPAFDSQRLEVLNFIEARIDTNFGVRGDQRHLLECGESCHHCTCDYLGVYCTGRCGGELDLDVVNEFRGLLLCPDIFNYRTATLKAGVFVQNRNALLAPAAQLNYDLQVLQAAELITRGSFDNYHRRMRFEMGLLFAGYFSPRGVNITHLRQREGSKFSGCCEVLRNAATTANVIERHQFDEQSAEDIVAELVTASFGMDYLVLPCNGGPNYPLSTLLAPEPESLVLSNLASTEEIKHIQQLDIVDKEPFQFPPIVTDDDYEPEVDFSVLKKDQNIIKLKTVTQNYKILPDDMFKMHQKQHPELFDTGVFQHEPYRTPQNFNETRQLANSVLNRGRYFTIPFGSEAQHVANDVVLDTDLEDNFTRKTALSTIKSQYLMFSTPTGAEARVCHIEEEQLCFGLFNLRTNQVLKLLVAWMCVYTPSLIKFLRLALHENVALASLMGAQHLRYRQNFDQRQERMNNYFYQGEYKTYEDDDPRAPSDAFSEEFDREVLAVARQYAAADTEAAAPPWVEHPTYAPVSLASSQFQLPSMPQVLQLHLTQVYGSGKILTEMARCPVITIPIIVRTLQKQVFLNSCAEQRAAIAWRLLYPESYYKSIDHATICLAGFDKKFMQNKVFQADFERRRHDMQGCVNPNQLDCFNDVSLPKIFEAVYSRRFKLKPDICYEHRLRKLQAFVPPSAFNWKFKMTFEDLQHELLRHYRHSPESAKQLMQLTRRIGAQCTQQFDPYSNDYKQALLQKAELSASQKTIFGQFPAANVCVLTDLIAHALDFQPLGQPPVPDAAEEEDNFYLEAFLSDLQKTPSFQINDAAKQLYSEADEKSLFDCLKQVSFDSGEMGLFYRGQLEKLLESNMYISSAFAGSDIKNLDNVYTRYRPLSLPSVTVRSLFMLRTVLFNEKFDAASIASMMAPGVSYAAYRAFIVGQKAAQQALLFEQLASQKAVFQVEIAAFQLESVKKAVFDDFFAPLLCEQAHLKTAFLDNEQFFSLKLLHIILTRLEFSLLILEKTSDLTRQSAVCGTRFQHNIPYSYNVQLNTGCSVFGSDVKAHLEQQTRGRICDTVPAQVSQRIFYGHQPYINLQNTVNDNAQGCKCGQLKCAFCGGIGAGYNGGLSGSINIKYTTPVDLNCSLANGAFPAKTRVLYDAQQITDGGLLLNDVEPACSLLYRLAPVIPCYKFVTTIFSSEDDFKQLRKMRRGSKSETSSENDCDDEQFIAKKLEPPPKQAHLEYFPADYGARLCDVVTLPPPLPFFHNARRTTPMELKMAELDYGGLPVQRPIEQRLDFSLHQHLNHFSQVLAPDDVVFCHLNAEIPDFDEFQVRNIILKPQRQAAGSEELFALFHQIFASKDDELTTEVYAVLGIYAYPFLSLKKHLLTLAKRVEGLSQKLLNHHFDAANLALFRSSKSTPGNLVSVLFATFAMFCERNGLGVAPFQFDRSFVAFLADNQEEVYFCENYAGFLNISGLK